MGLFDANLAGDEGAKYAVCKENLEKVEHTGEWSLLFETQKALCQVLELKALLGVRTHKIYAAWKAAGDKMAESRKEMEELLSDYRKLLDKLDSFYKTYKKQWFSENKPHGFDVQDIRLGGLSRRIQSCLERLEDLYQGKIQVIEELEEEQLDIRGVPGTPGDALYFNSWSTNVTANVL